MNKACILWTRWRSFEGRTGPTERFISCSCRLSSEMMNLNRRYSRDEPPALGAPLPSAEGTPESPSVPTVCTRCGSRLTCELQLVPEFAETLRLHPTNVSLAHLHFLSVLVFTCSQSCWQSSDTLVKEFIVFQPEVVWIVVYFLTPCCYVRCL